MTDPVDNLLIVAAVMRKHGPVDAADWFEDGLKRHMAGESLDLALGLSRREVARWRKQEQHEHLGGAWNMLDSSLQPWSRAGRLANAISDFEHRCWPRWRRLGEPPPGASAIFIALFHAREFGPLPEGQKRLHDLFKNSSTEMDC